MNKNTQAFSLVMAMGIVILITLLAFLILEYIIPYGKNVKGIENSSKAYYQAQSGIELALLDLAQIDTGENTNGNSGTTIGYEYSIIGNGSVLPRPGEGNSEYDDEWNIIAPGQPIQLEIGGGVIDNWDSARFAFRIPDLESPNDDVYNRSTEPLRGSENNDGTFNPDGPIINWQIGSINDLLTATGTSFISASQVSDIEDINNGINMVNFIGATLEYGDISIVEFYNDNVDVPLTSNNNDSSDCSSDGTECKLRFSIINPLILEVGTSGQTVRIPYLEWQFSFEDDAEVPLRYANIESDGSSFGFKKQLEIKVPQQTIVEAFDFTVFQ